MTDEMHGHVTSIATKYRGGTLTADAATGATALIVDDVADFAAEGGSLRVAQADGTFLAAMAYTTIDDDAATITLGAPTTVDVFEGAIVRVLDANGKYVADVEAQLSDDGDGLPVTIDVHHSLIPLLTDAMRAGTDESVVATRDEHGTWTVVNVLGKTPVLDAPHARRDRATNYTIADSSDAVLVWDAFPATRGGLSVDSGVWTVPSDGRYLASCTVQFDVNATGQRRVWFLVNGAWAGAAMRIDAAAAGSTHLTIAQTLDLDAGDEVTVMVRQNSTAPLAVLAGSTATITGLD